MMPYDADVKMCIRDSYVSFMIIAALMMMGIDTSWLLVAAGFVGAIVIASAYGWSCLLYTSGWTCPAWMTHPLIQCFIVLLYLCSAAYAIASAVGYLPAGW